MIQPMNASDEFECLAEQLVLAGRLIDQKGWVPATSGNFSARLADGRVAITVSGRHKGRLTPDDIMLVDADGQSLDGRTSSAETRLHTRLYQRYPDIRAVLHPHSPGSTLISRRFKGSLALSGYELLKALPGITTHLSQVTVPIFPNDQDIGRLAEGVDVWLEAHPKTPGYIIESHGFYTWGDSVESALRHVEALEFLFDIEFRLNGNPTP